jgi:hypothetical protein
LVESIESGGTSKRAELGSTTSISRVPQFTQKSWPSGLADKHL